jgi:hypothetical protein
VAVATGGAVEISTGVGLGACGDLEVTTLSHPTIGHTKTIMTKMMMRAAQSENSGHFIVTF